MKGLIFIISIILLSFGNAFAQDLPITGQLKLHVFGMNQEIDVEINKEIWTFTLSNGDKLHQTVTIDNDKKTIIIPFLVAFADYFYFEDKGNYIDLNGGGKLNMPLQEMMLDSFKDMQGINAITDEFIEKFGLVMETAFFNIPILRLYRN